MNIRVDMKAIISAVLITGVTVLVYVAAYYYEVAYLTASNIPVLYAGSAAEVPLVVYMKFLAGVSFVAIGLVLVAIFFDSSERFRRLLSSKYVFILAIAIWVISSIAAIFIQHYASSSYIQYGIFMSGLTSLALVVGSWLFLAYLLRDRGLKPKDIFIARLPAGLKVVILLFGIFYLHQNVVMIASAIGKISASVDKGGHPTILIQGESHTLLRDYGHKLVLLRQIDGRAKVLYTSEFHSIEVR